MLVSHYYQACKVQRRQNLYYEEINQSHQTNSEWIQMLELDKDMIKFEWKK